MSDVIKKVEAIVFAIGRAISEQEISELSGEQVKDIHEALVELKKEYETRESPLKILQEGESWKLNVGEKYIDMVQQINPHTELSKSVLETLAVIAWKQPSTQSDIIKVRTNKAYEHIKELEEAGYVQKIKHGRSYLLKVTRKFLDYFDLQGDAAVKDIFQGVKDSGEAQEKLLDQEAVKDSGLDVYGTEHKENHDMHEHLGKLEVFEEVEEKEEPVEEPVEEVSEEPEEVQESKEEKDKEMIKKLAEGDEKPDEEETKEVEEPAEEERKLDPGLADLEEKEEKKDEE